MKYKITLVVARTTAAKLAEKQQMSVVNSTSPSWTPCPRRDWRLRSNKTQTKFRPLGVARSEIYGSSIQLEGCRGYISKLPLVLTQE